jgi:ferredoxin
MAKLKRDGQEIEVPDGEQIRDYAEQIGIIFGCKQGRCGTCTSQVLEGMENLEEKNEAEVMMGLPEGSRLCCQAKIKSGEVAIKQG